MTDVIRCTGLPVQRRHLFLLLQIVALLFAILLKWIACSGARHETRFRLRVRDDLFDVHR